ncbi:MAG: nucleotidyl transferase AbiEii/AbiGii toxin family protein [Luteolibacter sp.]|uniref:nucleotidyl transferase AbiEii/AbiGii toxin family protein n=1 Tax=Luteolibacter sp. TaxID=1962973 RepID=UPI0032648215
MKLHQDIHEFIELCLSRKVEFLLVGGYALAFHGAPRFTEDIDLMVLVSPENADKLHAVLADFGFGEAGITREDFLDIDQVIQLGRAPNRIDILTGISGVTWQAAWASRTQVDLDGLEIQVIGKTELIQNKQATGRPQDLADLARLRQENC